MWSSGRRVLQELLLLQPAVRSFSRTPAQNTVVVERWWQVPLSKVGSPPRLHPRRHRIYKLVEDTKHQPMEKMELILTQTVPRLGGRGDTVFVKKSIGRNKLLAKGLAVYPSPENKDMFEEELRRLRAGMPGQMQTRTGELTVKFLKQSTLKINRVPSDDFQLTKEIICRQFLKKLGVIVPPHTLNFPFESVKDVGEYWCEVTVNGQDTVRIPLFVTPYVDPSIKAKKERKAQIQQQAAEEVSDLSDVEEAAVKTVSDAAVEAAEAAKDSASEVSKTSASAGASAAEETTAEETTVSKQISQDSTAPPSDKPKTE